MGLLATDAPSSCSFLSKPPHSIKIGIKYNYTVSKQEKKRSFKIWNITETFCQTKNCDGEAVFKAGMDLDSSWHVLLAFQKWTELHWFFFFFQIRLQEICLAGWETQILSYGNNIDMREERKQIKVISELLKQTIWGVMMTERIGFDGCIKPL